MRLTSRSLAGHALTVVGPTPGAMQLGGSTDHGATPAATSA